jgi:hypothetical protein
MTLANFGYLIVGMVLGSLGAILGMLMAGALMERGSDEA